MAYLLLWVSGLVGPDAAQAVIDAYQPEGWEVHDLEKIRAKMTDRVQLMAAVHAYYEDNQYEFEESIFRDALIEVLSVCYQNTADLADHTAQCYVLWECLPEKLEAKEPYYSLGMVDDYLSYGDVEGVERILSKLYK